MKKHLVQAWILAMSFMLLGTVARAETPVSPRVLLEKTTHTLINEINKNRGAINKDSTALYGLIETHLSPHVDIIAASKWVLGKHWRRANKDEKLAFIRQFRTMLIRFYSTALADYLKTNKIDPNLIEYLPLRSKDGDTDVTVNSQVKGNDGKIIPVKYHMHLKKGKWKVYDVSVEGISIVTTYRSSFENEIKQNGIQGLIAMLEEKNKNLPQPKS